jgi:hypothetical protein
MHAELDDLIGAAQDVVHASWISPMRRSDSAGATPEHADLDTLDIELQVGHVPVPDWRVGHDQPGLDRTVRIQAVARVLSRGKPGGAD